MVTLDVPAVALAVAVSVNVELLAVVGLVLKAAETPAGRPSAASVTALAKFVLVRFTVTVPFALCAIESEVGVSDRVYELAGAAVTVSTKVAVTELMPVPLPVTVRLYVPGVTVEATDRDTVMVVVEPLV
jgi:hypothetical protein